MKTLNSVTIGNGKEIIPFNQLSSLQSLMATEPFPEVSKKYSFVPTKDIIKALGTEGWFPVLAQESRSKKYEGFQKHMIRFRNLDHPPLKLVGDLIPEIILTNAHNAKSSYTLRVGFFRLACSNGLIVADSIFGSIHLRHIGFQTPDIIEASKKVISTFPQVAKSIQAYRKFELTRKDQIEFAKKALILRYQKGKSKVEHKGDSITIGKRVFSLTQLLNPLRKGDSRPNLWNTFNIIQEKITQGGAFIIRNSEFRNARGVRGINRNIKFNQSLWELMDETMNAA